MLTGVGVYVGVGSSVANDEIRSADRAISSAIANQSSMDDAFDEIGADFQWLGGTNGNFPPEQLRPLADNFERTWRVEHETVSTDDATLAHVEGGLDRMGWLTYFSRGKLDAARARTVHGRKALALLATLSADLVQDGQFLRSDADAFADVIALDQAVNARDLITSAEVLSRLEGDSANAVRLSTAPGLPAVVQALMQALQKFAQDVRVFFNAIDRHDRSAALSATDAVMADSAQIGALDVSQVPAAIDAFYAPMLATYRSEARSATI